ncbi:hypothetical protein [Kineococcus arenarius]|uniref:hypothetical protein n=1 Tax=unclassified Kineococcus TaxID=2621656 RepID=UPI003D7D8B1E
MSHPNGSAPQPPQDPETLPDPVECVVVAGPVEEGQDWRVVTLARWVGSAERAGFRVEVTPDAGPPRPKGQRDTWCGNVRVFDPHLHDPGMVYRVHREPLLRMHGFAAPGEPGRELGIGWVAHDTAVVRPVTDGPHGVRVAFSRGDWLAGT